jgi:hypothetical protein
MSNIYNTEPPTKGKVIACVSADMHQITAAVLQQMPSHECHSQLFAVS